MLSRFAFSAIALQRLAVPLASQSTRIAATVPRHQPLAFQPIRTVSYFTRQVEELKKSVKDDKDQDLKNALEDLERDLKKLEETASFEKVKNLLEARVQSSSTVGGIMGVAHDISKVTKDVYHTIADSDLAKKTADELQKVGQMASHLPGVGRVTASIKNAAEAVSQTTDKAAKTVSQTAKAVEEKRQQRMEEKKKRQDAHFESFKEDKYVSSDAVKKLEASWDEFRKNDSNMQKIFNFQTLSDKSILGNLFHTLQSAVENLFSKSDLDKAIEEIQAANKSFNLEQVFKEMQEYTIPEILESYFEGRKNDLKDWVSSNAFTALEKSMDEREKAGQTIASKVTDIRDFKLVYAKLLDKNPMLVFSFTAEQAAALRDKSGNIIEGKEEEPHTVHYVMSIAKDSNYNKMTEGWKLLDIAVEPTKEMQQQGQQQMQQQQKEGQQQEQQQQGGQMATELKDREQTLRDMEKRQDEESENISSLENTGTWDRDPGLENKENWNKTWEKNKDKLKEKGREKGVQKGKQ